MKPIIEVKSRDNDFVVLKGLGSTKILARAMTYGGAREKAIMLGLENPQIIREKYLTKR